MQSTCYFLHFYEWKSQNVMHPNILPEKSLKDLSQDKFFKLYAVNTIGPALIAKYLNILYQN